MQREKDDLASEITKMGEELNAKFEQIQSLTDRSLAYEKEKNELKEKWEKDMVEGAQEKLEAKEQEIAKVTKFVFINSISNHYTASEEITKEGS